MSKYNKERNEALYNDYHYMKLQGVDKFMKKLERKYDLSRQVINEIIKRVERKRMEENAKLSPATQEDIKEHVFGEVINEQNHE